MKYKLDETISINNAEWRVAEYRLRGGREWVYTLSHESTDGSYTTMRVNEKAIDGIIMSGGFLNE
tara:strand:+ start:591 stop:785 length:195 start_codon:yes stop_codon:yes gene_type:complete